MDTFFWTANHKDHDGRWTISRHNKKSLCLACLTELLQNVNMITIKKKRVLSELLQIISKQSPILCHMLCDDLRVAKHLVFILLDLTKTDDQSFLSMTIEGCVKLLYSLESDELLETTLCRITNECIQSKTYEDCHPQLIIIGRLLHAIPALSARLLQDHGDFIDDIGTSLCDDNNESLSATVYILSYLFKCGEVAQFLPERLCLQVEHATLYHLGSVKNQDLTLNLLGLLKRLLASGDRCHAMMSLEVNGTTLCSVIKRLLISTTEVYQMAAVQCIQQVLDKDTVKHAEMVLDADIAEFLFEALSKINCSHVEATVCCLISLTESEQFFTRCHSLYGMEPVLRVLDASLNQRIVSVVKPAYKLLSILLERQPEKLVLLTSGVLVDSCLDIVHRGISHHSYAVIVSAITTFGLLMRKNHLHAPIPFSKLTQMLGLVCQRVKSLHKIPDVLDRGPGINEGANQAQKQVDVLKLFYTVVLSASKFTMLYDRLATSCEGQPVVCQENFTAPDTQLPSSPCSLDIFRDTIQDVCDDYCIPMIMMNWTLTDTVDTFIAFYALLSHVTGQSNMRTQATQDKLMSCGFLTSTVQLKAHFRSHRELVTAVNEYMTILFTYLGQKHDFTCTDDICAGLAQFTGTLTETITTILSPQDHRLHSTLLFTIYMCYWNDDCCLSETDLTSYIGQYLSHDVSISCLPHTLWKCFTFLIAVAHAQFGIEINPVSMRELFCLMTGELDNANTNPAVIFVDHPYILRWTFSSQSLADFCSKTILLNHLRNIVIKDSSINHELPPCSDVTLQPSLFDLLPNNLFRASLQTILTSDAENGIKSLLISFLHRAFTQLPQLSDWSRDIIEWYKTILPSIFLSSLIGNNNETEHCSLEILPLLGLLRGDNSGISPQELKIISSAISQLTKPHRVSENIQTACLHYISLFFRNQAVDSTSKTVSSMLLHNDSLLTKLQQSLTCDSTLTLLSMDVLSNLILNMDSHTQPSCSILLPASMITRLISPDHALQLSTIRLFSAYFASYTHTTLLTLTPTHDSTPGLTRDHLTTAWIYLQQACLHSEEVTRKSAMSCMRSLLQSQSTSLGDELISHRWNQFLLACLIQSQPLEYSLKFINLLMCRSVGISEVNEELLESVMESYVASQDEGSQVHDSMQQMMAKFPESIKSKSFCVKASNKLLERATKLDTK